MRLGDILKFFAGHVGLVERDFQEMLNLSGFITTIETHFAKTYQD
jgi:hypothetical protein